MLYCTLNKLYLFKADLLLSYTHRAFIYELYKKYFQSINYNLCIFKISRCSYSLRGI